MTDLIPRDAKHERRGVMTNKYRRCKTCKQLISVRHDDCPNCANKNPLNGFVPVGHGQSGKPTLDIQEGNWND